MEENRAGVCEKCGGPYRFDTSVPSVLWNRVIRPLGWGYLCASCVLREFALQGESFSAVLSGDGLDRVMVSIVVNDAESNVVEEIQQQNNFLRQVVSSMVEEGRAAIDSVTKGR
jgi:hypothetical protein